MDIKDILKEGGSIKLNYKDSLDSWYRDIRISWIDNQAFFEGFDYYNYRKNLNMDDAIYVFKSVYKSPNNMAYVLSKMNLPEDPEGDVDYDFEKPSDKFIQEIREIQYTLTKEWEKEFSQEKLDSLKKPLVDWDQDLETLADSLKKETVVEQIKNFKDYCFDRGFNDINVSLIDNGYSRSIFDMEQSQVNSIKDAIIFIHIHEGKGYYKSIELIDENREEDEKVE